MGNRRRPSAEGRAELVEKHSRFIGACFYTDSEQKALDAIASEKKRFPDARHHVYAYSVFENNLTRYSDDGEPQGTGGVPVFNRISGLSLTDCTVVVTRYFGGTLLGRGGLVRAYSQAAALAIEAAGIAELSPVCKYRVASEYTHFELIKRGILGLGGQVSDTVFAACAEIFCSIPSAAAGEFEKLVSEISFGKAVIDFISEDTSLNR